MTPSPKEEAKELILMYLRACDNKYGWFNTSLAKKAAIIAIKYTLEATKRKVTINNQETDVYHPYYLEVKQELQKL